MHGTMKSVIRLTVIPPTDGIAIGCITSEPRPVAQKMGIRPKTVVGLMPIFWATGRGSDVMQPMAIPSVGGMTVSLITLFIVPCLFCAVEEWKWKRQHNQARPR